MKHFTLVACLVILGHRACLGADRPNVLLVIADDMFTDDDGKDDDDESTRTDFLFNGADSSKS